ncbi:MFS transporter [Actinokineospora bangkokensis]|uniref:MFS transporter n=1 Tax=Actinokineospora bangkokensis TaxID=1193682 RepID=A0A1Q9LJJ6_9PSEU|nr:MFS transporter [Actinokineospora bangkokensis]OLR92227.1 MFS transporter [Actinokineospora bangkokensis]
MISAEAVVQGLPWKWRVQGQVFLVGGLGFLFDAWDVTLNGFLVPLLAAEWGTSLSTAAWLGTANLAGMAVGACSWGVVADALGRRRAFAVTLLVFAGFSVAGAFAPDLVTFCVLRFFAGVGLGGCVPVDFVMVSEFTPAKVRGRVVAGMDLWWPVGATIAGVVAAALQPNWRAMLLCMVAPALLLFWLRLSVPESPMYLAAKGREEEARRVVDDLVRRTGATPRPYSVAAPAGTGTVNPFRGLVQLWREAPRTTGVLWALFAGVFLVYFGALTWLPSILKAQGYGTYAAFLFTALMNAIGIAGVVVSALLVDVVGRKRLIGISGPVAGAALVLFGLALDLPWLALVWLGVYGFVIELAIPALYAYATEVYPTRLRGAGFGWASTASRVSAGVVPLLLGAVLWPALGIAGAFAVLTVAVVAASLWLARGGVETAGAELPGSVPVGQPEVS